MKSTFLKLAFSILIASTAFKGLSQDSINVIKWQLKTTIEVEPPDSIYESNSKLNENKDLIKGITNSFNTVIYISVFVYEKDDNLFILKKFDTLISPNFGGDVSVSEGLKTNTYLMQINTKNNSIYFSNGKSKSDSIFSLDNDLNYMTSKEINNRNVFFYKNGKIKFSSNLKLNSIKDIFVGNKNLQINYVGFKGIFKNELTFIGNSKIKNFDPPILKKVKYKSNSKKGIFDNFFIDYKGEI